MTNISQVSRTAFCKESVSAISSMSTLLGELISSQNRIKRHLDRLQKITG